MTEAADGDSLARALALCALPFSATARERLLALLPADAAAQVGDWLRRPEALAQSATSSWEAALLARATVVEETEDDEGIETDDEEIGAVDAEDLETALPEVLVAALLSSASAADAAGLLPELPLIMQGEVTALLATSTPLSVFRSLPPDERPVLGQLRQQSPDEQGGVQPACAMLRDLRGTRRLRRALSATAETNAEAAAIIQSHLFDFEDLTRLRTKELQLLLGRIDNATLARSLVEASDRVADRIFTNASDRRALLLREELELYVELTPEEIEGARSEVMAMIRTLYERGDITTYFGSIRRADGEGDTDDEEEEDEEEFEDDIDVEESGESAGDKKGVGSGVAVRRLVALLAAVAVTLLLVALGSLMGGDQSPKKTASRPSVARAAANGGRVLVTSGQQDPEEKGDDDGEPRQLRAGEKLQAPGPVDAMLEFPDVGGARVDVAPGAEVEGLAATAEEGEEASEQAAGLYLRVGRVTVTAVARQFTVRTPVAHVTGAPGSVFTVRVVLDASTQVRARRGVAEVFSREGRHVARLAPGEGLRLDGAGEVELSP